MNRVIEEVSVDNEWREKEFTRFRIVPDDVDSSLWFRMCVPMIYAHWEGFVVDALRTLLRHLRTLNLTHEKVTTNLVVLSLNDAYRPLSGKQSFQQRIEFTESFKRVMQNVLNFETKVDTKANLNSKVLQELCSIFMFDFNQFENVIDDIDRLVQVRNSIAHGENSLVVNQDDVDSFLISVQQAIDALQLEINKFLEDEVFLLPPVLQQPPY